MSDGSATTARVRYASEFDASGYAVAAHRSIDALIAAGVDLAWQPLVNVPAGRVPSSVTPSAPRHLRARRRPVVPGETLVVHSVPRAWARVHQKLRPARMIGHTVWEADVLPERWHREMDMVDEFWVPTEWNRDVFAATFHRPVHVVPHVVDTTVPGVLPLDIDENTFVVECVAAWDWRKRPDRTVQAYLEAFSADDDVVLVLKTTPEPVSWWAPYERPAVAVTRMSARYREPAPVVVITETWTPAEMAALHARADVFVSLTAAEGWGLGAFDAAVRGTPVLTSDGPAPREWMGADHPGLLPVSQVPARHPDRELFDPSTMQWGWADLDTAVDRLRALRAGDDPGLLAAAAALAPAIRARYAPEVVGRVAAGLLDAEPAPNPGPSPAPRTARVGGIGPTGHDASKVLVLTPVKDAARHAAGWVDRVLALDHPHHALSAAVLVSDSVDGSAEAFRHEMRRLDSAGIDTALVERDFGYRIPDGLDRSDPRIQLERRLVLARSRNHLLFAALGDHDWVLWVDADVIGLPPGLLTTLLAVGAHVVHPNAHGPNGSSFDHNAWTDHGRWHLDDYAGCGPIELHAVGGTVLLVRADRHRDGLVWPSWRHGVANERVRRDPERGGGPPGEIESEGLGILADDMGIGLVGLPDVIVEHE